MITKVSDITNENIADYIKLVNASEGELNELGTFLKIAKEFIKNYTGIKITSDITDEKTLDDYSDFIIVVYVLCQDMYDNRSYYVDGNNLNKVVETILNMHCVNLL